MYEQLDTMDCVCRALDRPKAPPSSGGPTVEYGELRLYSDGLTVSLRQIGAPCRSWRIECLVSTARLVFASSQSVVEHQGLA
jgi:hypothetical protein